MPVGSKDFIKYAPLISPFFDIISVTTTEQVYELPTEVSSISIANDGPDIVYIRLNKADAPQIKLYAGDAFSADMFVTKIYHKAETKPSKIRILGGY